MPNPKNDPVCKKTYEDADGKMHKTLPADPTSIVALYFNWLDDGEPSVVRPEDYSDEMNAAFSFFGKSECYGNAYAGVKGDVVAARILFDKRVKTIKAGGWSSQTGGGGSKSDSILAAAMLAHFADIEKTEDKNGATIDAVWIRSFLLAADVSDDDAKETSSTRKKSWMANTDVKDHYDRIRAERETAKAATVDAADVDDI